MIPLWHFPPSLAGLRLFTRIKRVRCHRYILDDLYMWEKSTYLPGAARFEQIRQLWAQDDASSSTHFWIFFLWFYHYFPVAGDSDDYMQPRSDANINTQAVDLPPMFTTLFTHETLQVSECLRDYQPFPEPVPLRAIVDMLQVESVSWVNLLVRFIYLFIYFFIFMVSLELSQ